MNSPLVASVTAAQRPLRLRRRLLALVACSVLPLAAMAQSVGITTLAGQAGSSGLTNDTGTAARFNNPAGLASDGTTLYVADSANNAIRKVTISTGAATTFATGFSGPMGVAIDGSGNAFVADTLNHVIKKITSGGSVSVLAGSSGTSGSTNSTLANSRFFNPQGIAVNSAGTLVYVADTGNNLVRKVDVSGDAVTTIASGFKPYGLALNSAGTVLYVTDYDGHTIRSITLSGPTLATVAGTSGTSGSTDSPALFKNPSGITVDSSGDLYVADTGNNIIRKISGSTVTTLAGTAGTVGNADGLSTSARFNAPFGIVATAANTLLISDTNNHTIRRALPASAPSITSANNTTFTLSSPGTFTVTATGSPAPTFSITSGSLPSGVSLNTTSGVISGTPTASGSFSLTLQASNGVGSAATQSFTLTVNQAPSFTSPNTATFSLNSAGSFTLVASGSPTPTYGLSSGSFPPWASLNTSTGAITGTPTNTTGSPFTFTVSATNSSGSATQSLTLTVSSATAAQITASPSSAAVNAGQNASFTGSASGNPTPTLRWQRQPSGNTGFSNLSDDSTYSGTATSTLTVASVTSGMNGDQFRLVASNSSGPDATSSAATLTVNSSTPAFSVPPQNTTIVVGQNGTLSVTASGNPSPTLRWQRQPANSSSGFSDLNDDSTYSGVTSSTLTITNATVSMSGDQFRVVATNVNGSTSSSAATLTVSASTPTITTNPTAVIANAGQNITYTGAATGVPSPTFRWRRQPSGTTGFVDLSDDSTYSGTTSTTLTITGVTAGMTGDMFQLAATNVGGTTSSTSALLTVNLGTTITTFAGSAGASGSTDATGTAARFNTPASIAVDSSGNFYIADQINSVIRKMTPSGVVTTIAGLAGSRGNVDGTGSDARFNSPAGVAVDGAGNVYVADTYSHTIRVIGSTGVVTTLAGTAGSSGTTDGQGSEARFWLPTGLAVDSSGTLYVADSGNHTIRRITITGAVTTFAGAANSAGFYNHSIGTSARFNAPMALVFDTNGNLYVADSQNNAIRKITSSGDVSTFAGNIYGNIGSTDATGTDASFYRPSGITRDASNNLYVADTNNHTIRRISTSGEVTTLAGSPLSSGSTDGTGGSARFTRPFGIVVDSNGNVYIADTGNHTIRRSGTTSAPQISTQPATAYAGIGQNATFSVVATGSPSPTNYQWQRQGAGDTSFSNLSAGATYSGVNTATLTVSNVTSPMNGDQFRVVVSNGVNPSAVSNAASLSIGVLPVFTSASSASFRAGEPNSFTVTTTSSTTVTYGASGLPSWASINTSTGVLSGTPPDTTGSPLTFTLTANNGVIASQVFVLTILPPSIPPTFATQPASVTSDPGQGATFSVTVNGTAPFTYQWRKNGVPITGATDSTLVLAGVQAASAGAYSVAVTNAAGSVVSSGATLTMNVAPTITAQPRPQVALLGGSATFSVTSAGGFGHVYQWRKNGVSIAGANTSTLTLVGVTAADVGNYDVVVANGVGSVRSSIAQLTLASAASAPVITTQPASRSALAGTSVTLSASATGAPAPAYQWRKNGAPIGGANSATLTFATAQAGDAGVYDVVVSNTAGTATSSGALLRVFSRSYAGVYFGSFGGGLGSFALYIRDDHTGIFLGYLPGSTAPVMSLNVSVSDTGQFTFVQGMIASSSSTSVNGTDEPARAAAFGAVSLIANIATDGTLSGTILGGANASLTGARATDTGSTQHLAGFYQAGANNNAAVAYTIVGANGQAFLLLQAGAASDGGSGTVTSAGQVAVTTTRTVVQETINPFAGTITGSAIGAVTTSFAGGSSSAVAIQRLVNISSRARVGSGDSVAIAGFVVAGVESKPVLIRAVGPTLGTAPFNVPGALAAPRLELYRGSTSIGVNSGIAADRAAVDAAGQQVGAFTLGAAGTDAAIVTTLAPGNYTAVVSSATSATGVVLVEVYDLSGASAGQNLLNISTRAAVGTGENVLIAGFVVPPGTTKRVLIRGVGPGLSAFGVTGTLAQPVLALVGATGATVAANTNWMTSADAAAITAASLQVGAFGLTNNDSALIATLAPGNYTAQVAGAGTSTGIALIEVYELP